MRKSIILVIDGVDKHRDILGKEETPDWLPSEAPSSIKLIYSCSDNSKSYKILRHKAGHIIHIPPMNLRSRMELYHKYTENLAHETKEDIQEELDGLARFVEAEDICGNCLYINLLLSLYLHKVPNLERLPLRKLEKCKNTRDLFICSLKFYNKRLLHGESIYRIFGYLAVTRNGLALDEIYKLIKCKGEHILKLLKLFDVCLVCHKGLYSISNEIFKETILSMLPMEIDELCLNIGNMLEESKLTIRNLDEQLHQYYEGQSWMRLKDKLIDLEAFTIMFTPDYKLELAIYWQKLIQHTFDPVQEYNKSLENFVTHYVPNNQELFLILVQFCRFFKEFADFEAATTPEYKHPHLRGYYELRDINFLDEVENLEGMFTVLQPNTSKNEEAISEHNKVTFAAFKQNILEQTALHEQNKIVKLYYYKRWLWIQFPWCSLDVFSDFSQIIKKFNSYGELMNQNTENELAFSSLAIYKNAKAKATRKHKTSFTRNHTGSRGNSPSISRATLSRTFSTSGLVKSLGFLPDIRSPIYTTKKSILESSMVLDEEEPNIHQVRERAISCSKIRARDKEFTFDVMFKELTPDNVLFKLGSQVVNYTKKEQDKIKKENYELQRYYNRLVNECRMKKLRLDDLNSQLAKSEDKIKEQEEIKDKISKTQIAMEKLFEKINKAEVEGRRLEQTLSCAFKNPAKNDEWERHLEKSIEQLKAMIEYEETEMKACELETQTLEEQMKQFQDFFVEKIKYQNFTIDRVAEQFMMKANLKETLQNGEKRREKIRMTSMNTQDMDMYRNRLKERDRMKDNIKKAKEVLSVKLEEYSSVIEKLQKGNIHITNPQDLTNLIFQYERYQELIESKEKFKKKLEDLICEKDALEVKLEFLKSREEKYFKEQTDISEGLETLQNVTRDTFKRLKSHEAAYNKEKYIIVSCTGVIEQMWKQLKLDPKADIETEDKFQILMQIGDRLQEMSNTIKNIVGTVELSEFEKTIPEVTRSWKLSAGHHTVLKTRVSNLSPDAESSTSVQDSSNLSSAASSAMNRISIKSKRSGGVFGNLRKKRLIINNK